MIAIPGLAELVAGYDARRYEPMTVICELDPGSVVGGVDLPTLDGLLAGALVRTVTGGRGVDDTAEPYDLPLPLACLWRSPEGLPLWAATPLRPVGESDRDVVYCHRRQQPGTLTAHRSGRFVIKQTEHARFTDRRIPVPVTVAHTLIGECIGDPHEVLRLLASVYCLGKRRNAGMGTVAAWSVAEGALTLVRDGALTRSVPSGAAGALGVTPRGASYPVGWTPPPWKPALWSDGWPAGTPCEQRV